MDHRGSAERYLRRVWSPGQGSAHELAPRASRSRHRGREGTEAMRHLVLCALALFFESASIQTRGRSPFPQTPRAGTWQGTQAKADEFRPQCLLDGGAAVLNDLEMRDACRCGCRNPRKPRFFGISFGSPTTAPRRMGLISASTSRLPDALQYTPVLNNRPQLANP